MSNKDNNVNDGFGRGIVLIIIGVVALLITLFDFEVDWHVVLRMWPLLLIIAGVCIMPVNRWIRTAVVLVLLAAGYIAYQNKADVTRVINKTEIISSYSDSYPDDE